MSSEISRLERVIQVTGTTPVTRKEIVRGLGELGVVAGDLVIVHSSLSRMGWVVGGAQAVVEALFEAVGAEGTLVMPAHSSELSNPANWRNPPVPESWWAPIREAMPAFDVHATPTDRMGAICECFRALPAARRSEHPQVSFCASGPLAATIVDNHELEYGLGEGSPLARCYEHGAKVLLLGVGHDRNTSLHLGEHRADWPSRTRTREGAPLLRGGTRQWVEFDDLEVESDDFARLGEAFERSSSSARQGRVGKALCRLMSQVEVVDFAREWISANRG